MLSCSNRAAALRPRRPGPVTVRADLAPKSAPRIHISIQAVARRAASRRIPFSRICHRGAGPLLTAPPANYITSKRKTSTENTITDHAIAISIRLRSCAASSTRPFPGPWRQATRRWGQELGRLRSNRQYISIHLLAQQVLRHPLLFRRLK